MAIITGATVSTSVVGNREDLSDVLWDVSPTDTPLLSMMGKTEASATTHEWLTEALAAAADNKCIEGNPATGVAAEARVRLSNYCQILSKTPTVTGTQEIVAKGGGIKSEMAHQVAQKMKEIKRDLEFAMIGQANAKVNRGASTAPEMGSLHSYLVTNTQKVSPSTANAGNGGALSDGAGTDAALTETILKAGLSSLYTNSGGSDSVNLVCNAANKAIISTFTGSSTRYAVTDDKKLVASIDVYVGDFHTVKVVPSRQAMAGYAYIVDPEYLKLAELRKLHVKDLPEAGDYKNKLLLWECTLEVCNEKAHVLIQDLSS